MGTANTLGSAVGTTAPNLGDTTFSNLLEQFGVTVPGVTEGFSDENVLQNVIIPPAEEFTADTDAVDEVIVADEDTSAQEDVVQDDAPQDDIVQDDSQAISDTMSQTTPQVVPQVIIPETTTPTVTPETSIYTNPTEDIAQDTSLEVDVPETEDLNINLKRKPNTDNTRHRQDHVASRVTVNTTAEESSVAANTESVAQNVAKEGEVVVKVSDQVAASAKEAATAQVQDMSAKAKDKATANLQEALKTDTTVVDVKKGKAESDSKGNFSQNNASEQIIKMSVENTQTDKPVNPENFALNLDKQTMVHNPQTSVNNVVAQPKELNKTDIMNQINAKLPDLQQSESSRVTIVLKPENLGRIQLELFNSGNGIVARMLTDNQQVRELLDRNMDALKTQLGSQGVNVNNIKVESAHHSSNNAMNFDREQFNQNFSRNHENRPEQNQQASQDSTASGEDVSSEELASIAGTDKSESQIIHNGKVDYKV